MDVVGSSHGLLSKQLDVILFDCWFAEVLLWRIWSCVCNSFDMAINTIEDVRLHIWVTDRHPVDISRGQYGTSDAKTWTMFSVPTQEFVNHFPDVGIYQYGKEMWKGLNKVVKYYSTKQASMKGNFPPSGTWTLLSINKVQIHHFTRPRLTESWIMLNSSFSTSCPIAMASRLFQS